MSKWAVPAWIVSNLSAIGSWIWRGKAILAYPITIILVAVLCFVFPSERGVRWIGLALQFLGIVTAVHDIHARKKAFRDKLGAGDPRVQSVCERLRHWCRNRPWARQVISASANLKLEEDDVLVSSANVYSPVSPTLDLEERLRNIEDNLERLRESTRNLQISIQSVHSALDTKILTSQRELSSQASRLGHRLEDIAVGTVQISELGALWLFLGVFLSTAPPEVASSIRWLKELLEMSVHSFTRWAWEIHHSSR